MRRIAEYGANRLETPRHAPLALRLARQFTHFFALILWAAAGLALAAEWHSPGQGMAALGIAIELILVAAIVFTTPGQAAFGTAPLPLEAWLFMLPFAAAFLALEELRKFAVRRRRAP